MARARPERMSKWTAVSFFALFTACGAAPDETGAQASALTAASEVTLGQYAPDSPFTFSTNGETTWSSDFDRIGYRPLYTPGSIEFDPRNQPFIRAGGVVQTIVDGGWVRRDFTASIKAAYPSWDGLFRAGGATEERVVFDSDGDAYMHVATAYISKVAPLSTTSLILHSKDRGEHWRAYPAWNFNGVMWEHRDGFNDRTKPPVLFDVTSGVLSMIEITKLADGTLSLALRRNIATNVAVLGIHSGGGNMAVSRGNNVHFAYASMTPAHAGPGPGQSPTGTPVYAATYNRVSKTFTTPVFLGYGGSTIDDHNSPAITVDSAGRLHVVFGGHQSPALFHTQSTGLESTAAWSVPEVFGSQSENPAWGHTYVSLSCDKRNQLNVVTRWSGRRYEMRVAFLSKPAGGVWSGVRTLAVPARTNYQVWHQKLSMDLLGRMYLFLEHEPHNLTLGQYESYNRTWPGDNLLAEGTPPVGGYRWYNNVRPHWPALLFSGNQGLQWRVALTAKELSSGSPR